MRREELGREEITIFSSIFVDLRTRRRTNDAVTMSTTTSE